MAGFFGLFNYEKEGPGISKNAPKKKTFIVFFETFFRNFWKFIPTNLIYSLLSLPVLTNGLAAVGITHVTRNTARDKHSFGLSDFFETIKKNWKQSLAAGIINSIVYAILLADLFFFYSNAAGWFSTVGVAMCLCLLFIFTVMGYYIWTLMITFHFSMKQIYKNSFRFVFINMKLNLLCFFVILLVYAINAAILFLLGSYWVFVLMIELILYALTFPCFKFLLMQYCVFPSVKKCIIDPYYRDHPFEDIEKRRDLGLEIEELDKKDEEEPEEDDDGEEPENVFED